MHWLTTLLFSVLLGIEVHGSPLPPDPVPTWVPLAGDRLVVDTEANVGYLLHETGRYTSFPVATGQRRTVRYIGRTYNATTPERSWVVRSVHTKADRMTFGPRGLFLRLYDDGEQTPYGIHGHGRSTDMLAEDVRFISMGCIIVSEDVLTLLEDTYSLNDGALHVTTTYGLPKLLGEIIAGSGTGGIS